MPRRDIEPHSAMNCDLLICLRSITILFKFSLIDSTIHAKHNDLLNPEGGKQIFIIDHCVYTPFYKMHQR